MKNVFASSVKLVLKKRPVLLFRGSRDLVTEPMRRIPFHVSVSGKRLSHLMNLDVLPVIRQREFYKL